MITRTYIVMQYIRHSCADAPVIVEPNDGNRGWCTLDLADGASYDTLLDAHLAIDEHGVVGYDYVALEVITKVS
jgi:hypothetical protein